jgi:phospholipid/cholesterol/gamma-HCH transport system permease protein
VSTEASKTAGGFQTPLLRLVGRIGAAVWTHWDEVRYVAAVIGTVLCASIRPQHWGRNLRNAFARQVLVIGVEPLWFVGALAVFVGISVVVQLSFWVGEAGQSQLLGPLLVAVVARELGPVLINLVVLVRSGSAMTTELGVLKINGEVRTLEAQGNDPFLHLVMPRVLGMAVSTFCLTIVFILVAFASGYLFAAWMGKGSRDLLLFADTVSRAAHPKDVFNILAQSLLPGYPTGAHPLRRRPVCHLRRGIVADLLLTMNATARILNRHPVTDEAN